MSSRKPLFLEEFNRWVREKRYGDMEWINRSAHLRADPRKVLTGCNTIICLAYPYSATIPCTKDGLKAARYTEGLSVDYHVRLKRLARPLVDIISNAYPGSKSRVCVDSAPLLERSYAYAAGIGYFGKNNMLIIPGYGSYFYLAEILTTASMDVDMGIPLKQECGPCTACLEACPTGALERPFLSNSQTCLSYLTIESKNPVSVGIGQKMGNCFFGCDVCQEVCPHNKQENSVAKVLPSSREILEMDYGSFKEIFGNTAFARAGLDKIKSNLRAIVKRP